MSYFFSRLSFAGTLLLVFAWVACSYAAATAVAIGSGPAPAFLGSPNATGAKAADIMNGQAITITTGAVNEAASVFSLKPVNITAFRAEFTYQMSPVGHGKPADGLAFVLQSDLRGPKALGQDGQFLGYGGRGAITHSAALEINIFAPNTVGIALHSDGRVGNYISTDPVNLVGGHRIHFKLDYDGMYLHIALRDLVTGEKFTAKYRWNLRSHLGAARAFVGFTGGCGGLSARQRVTKFSYSPLPTATIADEKPASLVNVFTGATQGGNMFPGASAPFGMVQLSPDTNDHDSVGYDWRDPRILGFSMLHMSSVGDEDGGDVFFTATTGPINVAPAACRSRFNHWHESAAPGYYQVRLLKPDVNVELTASEHAGVAKLTFPAGRQANLLVPISHTLTSTQRARIKIIGHREITGMVRSQAFAFVHQFYSVYFAMQFSQPFTSCGAWTGLHATAGLRQAVQAGPHHSPIGAYVSWPAGPARRITVKIGISFVDLAGAERNLAAELGDHTFSQVRRRTQRRWNNVFDRIAVSGGSLRDRSMLYTALYHATLMPSVFSDVDGRYVGFDQHIHQLKHGEVQYANYSGWDIYRTEAPMLSLLFPNRMAQMCQSIVRDYRQGGWMPRWPQYNLYTNIMCGSPLTNVICTAYRYGIHDFDVTTAYHAMLEDATTAPPPGKLYAGELAISYLNKLHYIPLDKLSYGSVSQTEEDCYACSALAGLATQLGRKADAAELRQRAMYYRNLFDPQTHWMRPKDSNGQWTTPFSPAQEAGYVEGVGWQYLWYVPHDVAGLVNLLGRRRFNHRLDEFFAVTNRWNHKNYNPYNEPDIQSPYFYNWSGKPWKTQSLVRHLCRSVFGTGAWLFPQVNNGMGNDDCGTMSSWLMFSMMGFYPVDPASGTFVLASPVFKKVTIQLRHPYPGRAFTISAPDASAANKYIQSVWVDRVRHRACWFKQNVIANGGSLRFILGPKPNRHWGVGAANEPPSLSVQHPDLLKH